MILTTCGTGHAALLLGSPSANLRMEKQGLMRHYMVRHILRPAHRSVHVCGSVLSQLHRAAGCLQLARVPFMLTVTMIYLKPLREIIIPRKLLEVKCTLFTLPIFSPG